MQLISQAHLKNVLPKYVSDFGKIKMEKAKESIPKHSSTPFDQAAPDEFEKKRKLFQMMRKSMSYTKHPSHKALFNALALSLSVDEYDMEKELNQPHVQKKRRRDDHAQDLPRAAEKDSKKKKRKDSDAPSSKKTKDQPTFSNK
ncbi:hypothetical protein Tco_0296975, partial [Tanacetum coccineum]